MSYLDEYKKKMNELDNKQNKSALDTIEYNSALKAYNNQLKLDDDLNNQKQEAYTNQQKILKYLPNQLKTNGLSGNYGATTQLYLDANNDYQNSLNKINTAYTSNSLDLRNNYADDLDKNLELKKTELNDAFENYKTQLEGYLNTQINDFDEQRKISQESKNNLVAYANELKKQMGLNGLYEDQINSMLGQHLVRREAENENKIKNGDFKGFSDGLISNNNLRATASKNFSETGFKGYFDTIGRFVNDEILQKSDAVVNFGNKTYESDLLKGNSKRSQEAEVLKQKFANAKNGDVYKYNGNIYAFVDGDWYRMRI